MKKRIVFIGAGLALVLLIISTLFIQSIRFPKTNRPVAFIESLTFDMTPREVKNILGLPDQITQETQHPRDVTYCYNLKVAGHDADVYCTFKRLGLRTGLCNVSVNFGVVADAEVLNQTLLDMIKKEYSQKDNYYEEQYENSTDLGIQNGAVGVNFSVEVSGPVVSIHSICDEYDG